MALAVHSFARYDLIWLIQNLLWRLHSHFSPTHTIIHKHACTHKYAEQKHTRDCSVLLWFLFCLLFMLCCVVVYSDLFELIHRTAEKLINSHAAPNKRTTAPNDERSKNGAPRLFFSPSTLAATRAAQQAATLNPCVDFRRAAKCRCQLSVDLDHKVIDLTRLSWFSLFNFRIYIRIA